MPEALRGSDRPGRAMRRLAPTRAVARAAWILALLAAFSRPALAAKTDVITLKNGDKITGEVKGVSRGKLDYSTDDVGRLSIEWEKVASVTSTHLFDVEMSWGASYFGQLGEAGTDGYLVVLEDGGADTLRIASIVEISMIEAGLAQRIKSYLDLGFTLAKAHQATTFSLNGQTDFRAQEIGISTKYDSYVQGQENVATTSRNSIRQSVSWFLPDRWSVVALGQFEQNDELGLDHRWSYGGAAQRVLKHSNRAEVSFGAGLVGIQEQFTSAAEDKTSGSSIEGLLVLNWEAYRFDSPKLDFGTNVALFPSLSDPGRVRGQMQVRLKYEVFSDFNVGTQFTDNFDSRPPGDTSKNDYIATLTIGWSYRR